MKKPILYSFLFLTILACRVDKPSIQLCNPLPMPFGDPFILQSSEDKTYYMYGTSENINGFKAYSSTDLCNWEDRGVVYDNNQENAWGINCFWAPEVYERDGKYYIWYSANWKHNPTHEEENFRIGVAVADSPLGPFKDLYDRPVFDPGYPIIDANLYFDETENRIYLYYSRCCYKNPVKSELSQWAKANGLFDEIEESWIYGIEINPDYSGVMGEPQLLLRPPLKLNDPQSEWESRSVTRGEVNRRWTEGSFLFKEKETYYMMYSANFFGGQNYAVGYATSDSPLGPFQKASNNPVLQKGTSKGGAVTGTGHNMVLTLPGNHRLCVYHARTENSGHQRIVFISPLNIDEDGKLTVQAPTIDEGPTPEESEQ